LQPDSTFRRGEYAVSALDTAGSRGVIELAGRRVLIVEDEPLIAMALEDVLLDLGCTIVGRAAGVDDALASIAQHAIDLAILDVNIEGGQSYAVADALRDRGVPFVFTTGAAEDSVDCRYADNVILRKPFMPMGVVLALRKALDSARQAG